MEITIKIDGRLVTIEVSTEVADYLEQSKHDARKLYREQQRYWDGREFDEYIIATESCLPYRETPEQYACRMETRREILAVLALCTEKQRERFLLHALYDLSYEEVGKLCGCSKVSVCRSIMAVRKKFMKFFSKHAND